MADLAVELERIRGTVGLTRSNVVNAARPRRSPLHDQFEWDNTVAAEAYRLVQAGNLIRKVGIRFIDDEGAPATVRRYWPVHEEGSAVSAYEPLETIAEDPVRAEVLMSALDRDWRAFRRRWQHVAGFVERISRDLAS